MVPLAIINHYKPTRVPPAERGISELYLDPTKVPHPKAAGLKQFFILIDRCLKILERNGILRSGIGEPLPITMRFWIRDAAT
jgi:hypothetical protein